MRSSLTRVEHLDLRVGLPVDDLDLVGESLRPSSRQAQDLLPGQPLERLGRDTSSPS